MGENLHIRIFDENRARIVDKPEAELLQGEPLISFKKKITVQCDLEKIDADVKVRQDADRIGQEVSKLTHHPVRLQANNYRLLLMSDDSLLPEAGRNLVIVAVTSAGCRPNLDHCLVGRVIGKVPADATTIQIAPCSSAGFAYNA